jgi:hypothetical protein
VVKLAHVRSEGGVDIRATVLQRAQQLFLRQRAQDRHHWIEVAVVLDAPKKTFPQCRRPDFLVHASL